MDRIGYLIPEFPGQTHSFFWRERQALRRYGVEAELISTRRPPRGIVSHSWSLAAMSETEYLFPVRPRHTRALLRGWGRSKFASFAKIASSVDRAEVLDGRGKLRLLALAFLAGRIVDLAARRGWRHLHAHSCGDAANVALFAHLLAGIPYSLTLHGPLADYGANQREKWRHAAFAVVITEQLRGSVHAELAGSLPADVEVAPMGVDPELFRRSQPYLPWPGDGPLRIFSCGRLNPCKGHLFAIEAVALLRQQGYDARLAIAGEDEAGGTTYRRTLQAERDRLGVAGYVELLGAVAEQRVRRELESAHVFASASLAEPLGVATMEAMALELPVVVTEGGGVRELVEHEVDGLLVPAGDSRALANGIERVARDGQLGALLGRAARVKVATRFHSGRSAELLAALIRRAH